MASAGKSVSKLQEAAADLFGLVTLGDSPATILHAARTAVAALTSLLIARLFRLPEAYWAAISTLIVMQSTLGAALPVSAQRFAGTAFGACIGALIGSFFPVNALAFALGIFGIGLVCAHLRVQRSAYRFASITLAIVMLLRRPLNRWVIAAHRFTEVSIGIAVGLIISALWPERRTQPSTTLVAAEQNSPPKPPSKSQDTQ